MQSAPPFSFRGSYAFFSLTYTNNSCPVWIFSGFIDDLFCILVSNSPYLQQQIKFENYKIYKPILFHLSVLRALRLWNSTLIFLCYDTLYCSLCLPRLRQNYTAECGNIFIRNKATRHHKLEGHCLNSGHWNFLCSTYNGYKALLLTTTYHMCKTHLYYTNLAIKPNILFQKLINFKSMGRYFSFWIYSIRISV